MGRGWVDLILEMFYRGLQLQKDGRHRGEGESIFCAILLSVSSPLFPVPCLLFGVFPVGEHVYLFCTGRGALASAGVRWKSATVLSHDDEEDMEHEKKDAKVTNTKGFVLDPVAADLVAAHYRPKPMSPHVTVMKARFNTMLSISSRIGAVWLAAVMYVPTTSAWILFMEYVPIGHFNALGIFSLISLGAHITFLTQNKHMLRTKWGQKGDVWKKSHEV